MTPPLARRCVAEGVGTWLYSTAPMLGMVVGMRLYDSLRAADAGDPIAGVIVGTEGRL